MIGSGTYATTNCIYCNGLHSTVCPMIKAIEYFEHGGVKRVEFKVPGDYAAPISLGGQHTIFPPPNS